MAKHFTHFYTFVKYLFSLMKILMRTVFLILWAPGILTAQTWPSGVVGRWSFDDPLNLLGAAIGNSLILNGNHTPIPGPAANDGAVAIDTGSYYSCYHTINPNGGGNLVNKYSILIDVLVPNPRVYHSLFQTNATNSNDGDHFINPYSQTGIGYTGYSGFALKPDTWYRLLISVDLGSRIRYYIDGQPIHHFTSPATDVDGRFALNQALLFFADDNGEDNLLHVAQIALFDSALTDLQVLALGGFHPSGINPYLQSPTHNSMYVCWNSFHTASTVVQYGTTVNPASTATGSYEDIGSAMSSIRWHSVKLTGLTPNTRYYYRCISGCDTSAVYHFRTPPLAGTPGRQIRFLKIGDSQTEVKTTTSITDSILTKLIQLYGSEWADSLTFVMHSGDIMHLGNEEGRYMNEFFNPYSRLSPYVPFMISIGNHEQESAYFYKFMHYSDYPGDNERYYSFSLGNCSFISLNTNTAWQTQTQINWLKDQLNTSSVDTSLDFVFCYFHHPGFSEVWPDGNTPYVSGQIYPVQEGYPKMVMNTHGHTHAYERATYTPLSTGNHSFRNIICGGAGGILDRWGMFSNQVDMPDVQISLDHYGFMLVDVDMDIKTVDAAFYSLGHPDMPQSPVILDRWHWYPNQPPPAKPQAVSPVNVSFNAPVLQGSPFSGADTLMSSHFQLAEKMGDFATPLIDSHRGRENYYKDSGAPLWQPLNLNAGIDLQELTLDTGLLVPGQSYKWRLRYRDENLKWSEWSDSAVFLVQTIGIKQSNHYSDIFAIPNPSASYTHFYMPGNCNGILSITDCRGNLIRTLLFADSGHDTNTVKWDGTDSRGNRVSPGLYYCRVLLPERTVTLKIIRL